jgi:crotonobetainyl-CoA:carnitine CoA-transferase CaiB-like acyl-CoA transferase
MIKSLPLAGVRVLDLTRVLAGPLCTMMLADMGADVIKVERPGTGDETRSWGPPFDDHGESAYFIGINRNKLSVAANLRDGPDRDLLARLIAEADVVVDNFLPGVLSRAGLSIDELVARHERLVWCTITGFGSGSTRPGYDFVVQAESGWMSVTGDPGGEPMKSGIALADVIAGKDAATAVLAALVGRDRGAERRIIISLADSARAALVNVAQNVLVSGAPAKRWGNAHANLVPYQLFRARDQHLVVAVGSDAQWVACATALGLEALAKDQGLRTNAGRLARRAEVVDALAARIATADSAEIMRLLEAAGVPCGVVKPVHAALADAVSASPGTGMPSATGGSVRYPPPRLDEHGRAIRTRGWGVFTEA